MKWYKFQACMKEVAHWISIILGLVVMAEFAILLYQAIIAVAQR